MITRTISFILLLLVFCRKPYAKYYQTEVHVDTYTICNIVNAHQGFDVGNGGQMEWGDWNEMLIEVVFGWNNLGPRWVKVINMCLMLMKLKVNKLNVLFMIISYRHSSHYPQENIYINSWRLISSRPPIGSCTYQERRLHGSRPCAWAGVVYSG